MNFSGSDKNSRLAERLEKAVTDDRVSHAYIFEAPSGIDKIAFARSFMKGILCPENYGENCGKCSICDKIDHGNHEDITYIEKDGLSVKDAAVESIQEKLGVKPLGDRNIAVISDCDTMTAKAQNRLLKTLEEPPGNSVLILLSENIENLAQTILSRCVKFRLEGEDGCTKDSAAADIVLMALEGSTFYELKRRTAGYAGDRDKTEALLDSMEQEYRRHLDGNGISISRYSFDDIYSAIQEIESSRKKIRQGMSSGYAVKDLMLRLSK